MTTTAAAELEPGQAEIVRATLPLVGAHIDEITTEFYRRMFGRHPELLRNLFNRGNQAQGGQQRALAASIATFATHLVNPELPHPSELLSRIGHKHASLGVTAEQYPIVHEHLFAAIVEVLGADTVTAEVAAAWDRVYWIMADTLIALERDLYRGAGVADGDVFRRLRVTAREDDPSGAVLLTVAADGIATTAAAQYVSVGVTLPDGARQLRQYSLVNVPGATELTFAVKPVEADGDHPAGEVSSWIRSRVRVGDLLDVTVPFGDLPEPRAGAPVVLISAGIGVTPMIGLLEYLVGQGHQAPVQVLHADRSEDSHPLRKRHRELVDILPGGSLQLWYAEGVDADTADIHRGLMNLDGVDIADDAEIYLCGNTGFVQAVRAALTARGVAQDRVHCELFSPNDWLLDG
ncbi:globin domain-containing protein [Mycobacterium sp. shizuoka-1]|uniref:globin domain-containing protein n=1 Tax=Mycobacterium sp. shizuoka-1 TaxID=2039281 RepID=UPI000C05E8EC|nr:globin domain-containing protein [Mycobacterium sp. shizuoka-1]GAY16580.1 hemin transporter [Mycobacterium sp. shizuoka-1]